MNGSAAAEPGRFDGGGITVESRTDGTVVLTASEVARLLVVTLADYLDQMVTVNGWRDHHQVEAPSRLWPGEGKPAVALYWISAMCRAIRTELDVIPPAFGNCTQVVGWEDEVTARDLYWETILSEDTLSVTAQADRFQKAAELNPFIAEPVAMLAQLAFRTARYGEAARHAAAALERFYALGTAWDKRTDFAAWVAFVRLLLLRSNRLAAGLESLPVDPMMPATFGGQALVSLKQLVTEM
jgi:hypothetical protein